MGRFWAITNLRYDMGELAFKGHGQVAYNAARGKYVGTWIDSISDTMTNMEGDYDTETSTLTMMAEAVGPDGTPMTLRMVTVHSSETTKEFAMAIPSPAAEGEWITLMEIAYTKMADEESEK